MTRILRLLYALASLLAAHATVVSAQHGAALYALGFAAVDLLLLVAALREHLTAGERRAAAIRAERIVRLRVLVESAPLALSDLDDACCETWWTSCGTAHDDRCAISRWAA